MRTSRRRMQRKAIMMGKAINRTILGVLYGAMYVFLDSPHPSHDLAEVGPGSHTKPQGSRTPYSIEGGILPFLNTMCLILSLNGKRLK